MSRDNLMLGIENRVLEISEETKTDIPGGTSQKIAEGISNLLEGKPVNETQAEALQTDIGRQIIDEMGVGAEWAQMISEKQNELNVNTGARHDHATLAQRNDKNITGREKEVTDSISRGDTYRLVSDSEGEYNGQTVRLGGIAGKEDEHIQIVVDSTDGDSQVTAPFSYDGEEGTVRSKDGDINDMYAAAERMMTGNVNGDDVSLFGTSFGTNTGRRLSTEAANVLLSNYNAGANPLSAAYIAWAYDAYKAGASGMTFQSISRYMTATGIQLISPKNNSARRTTWAREILRRRTA